MDSVVFTLGDLFKWLGGAMPFALAWCWALHSRLIRAETRLDDHDDDLGELKTTLKPMPATLARILALIETPHEHKS